MTSAARLTAMAISRSVTADAVDWSPADVARLREDFAERLRDALGIDPGASTDEWRALCADFESTVVQLTAMALQKKVP